MQFFFADSTAILLGNSFSDSNACFTVFLKLYLFTKFLNVFQPITTVKQWVGVIGPQKQQNQPLYCF